MQDSSVTLYQDNKITQARYEFNVIEKRIIYLIIREIRNRYVTGVEANNNLFGDLVINLTSKDLKVVSDDSNLVYRSIRSLKQKFYEFDDNNQWMILGIINKVKHKKKYAVWEITVDQDMVEKFVELARNYTAYKLTVAMSLRSEHSQRMYEYCSQFKNSGGVKINLEELRFKMKLENKYSRYASFKKYVLEVAKNELKALYEAGQCDLYFEYSEYKPGRSVKGLTLKIISNNEVDHELSISDMDYFVRSELFRLFETDQKPKNKEFVTQTMNALRLEPENLKHCYEKIIFVKNNLQPSEWAKYLRFVIKEDYLQNEGN